MLDQLFSVVGQSSLFVLGVYIQKFIRRRIYTKEKGKEVKQTMRITVATIMTILILLYNYNQTCSAKGLGFTQCYFLSIHPIQILHVIVANSILFGVHIYQKFLMSEVDFSRYTLKSVFVAPILQELLFRASFYRSAGNQIPIYVLSLIFSVSHLHRPIRKQIKGKEARWKSSFGQVIFTLVFGIYSFYFLSVWHSVIPSAILHCYCNFLGPPSIRKNNLYYHLLCVFGMLGYCYFFIGG